MKSEINFTMKTKSQSLFLKFVVAFLILLSALLNYVVYDLPGSLQGTIEHTFSVKPYEYENMYTFYSIPAVFLCLFGGVVTDRGIALSKCSLVVGLLSFLGQILVTVGGFTNRFWIMLVGRLIYGSGAEILTVFLNCYIVDWFTREEANFVFGSFQSVKRLGSSIAFAFALPLYNHLTKVGTSYRRYIFGITLTPFLAVVFFLFLSVVILVYLTWRKNQKPNSNKLIKESTNVPFLKIIRLPLTYWLIAAIFATTTSTLYAFLSCSEAILQHKYNITQVDSNYLSSGFNIFSAIISPIIGLVSNKTGRELSLITLALALGIVSLIIFILTNWPAYVPLILFSISTSIVNTCTKPLIDLVVEKYQLATAFGILQSLVNVSAVISLVGVGVLLAKCGATSVFILCLSCLSFGFLCIIILIILDNVNDMSLNLAPKERSKRI